MQLCAVSTSVATGLSFASIRGKSFKSKQIAVNESVYDLSLVGLLNILVLDQQLVIKVK